MVISIRDLFRGNLKKIRRLKGLTQEALAEKLNTSVNYYKKIEGGKRWVSPEYADKIAAALGCTSAELYGIGLPVGEKVADMTKEELVALLEASRSNEKPPQTLQNDIDLTSASPDQLKAVRLVLRIVDPKILSLAIEDLERALRFDKTADVPAKRKRG